MENEALQCKLHSCQQALLGTQQLPQGGIEVRIAGGSYSYNDSTSCGTVTIKATEASPVVFRGDGKAIFDGSQLLDATQLKLVTNSTVKALLNPKAKDKVMVMPLKSSPSQLLWNGVPLTPSVWPCTCSATVPAHSAHAYT